MLTFIHTFLQNVDCSALSMQTYQSESLGCDFLFVKPLGSITPVSPTVTSCSVQFLYTRPHIDIHTELSHDDSSRMKTPNISRIFQGYLVVTEHITFLKTEANFARKFLIVYATFTESLPAYFKVKLLSRQFNGECSQAKMIQIQTQA